VAEGTSSPSASRGRDHNLDDGKELTFTVEVDIRPKFDLPTCPACPSPWTTPWSPDEVAERLAMLRTGSPR